MGLTSYFRLYKVCMQCIYNQKSNRMFTDIVVRTLFLLLTILNYNVPTPQYN